ncbi:50S ribosomal protein L24 [Candidatus Saccharibacteria bacterium RIFCSPHIGHO2_12_FULL_47_16b]|nr:MAG: 50S ribosomal protein L24 [Candidatus Saccharibacteria bacterium RIFCSPHIGHO2_12_FULL_47_16b]OGL39369.1 MAG: 50S ribosomal protein L24 [Candidatus Saccharibacteria bacterium RIFCSPLOWO2_02_FULL_46_7]
MKIRLKKGDAVIIRSGKYKGHIGKVLAVHPKLNKITVEGVNIVKRHFKPSRTKPQGGVIELTKPIFVSKVGLYDSSAKKASRVAYKVDEDGSKIRLLKTSGKEIK